MIFRDQSFPVPVFPKSRNRERSPSAPPPKNGTWRMSHVDTLDDLDTRGPLFDLLSLYPHFSLNPEKLSRDVQPVQRARRAVRPRHIPIPHTPKLSLRVSQRPQQTFYAVIRTANTPILTRASDRTGKDLKNCIVKTKPGKCCRLVAPGDVRGGMLGVMRVHPCEFWRFRRECEAK